MTNFFEKARIYLGELSSSVDNVHNWHIIWHLSINGTDLQNAQNKVFECHDFNGFLVYSLVLVLVLKVIVKVAAVLPDVFLYLTMQPWGNEWAKQQRLRELFKLLRLVTQVSPVTSVQNSCCTQHSQTAPPLKWADLQILRLFFVFISGSFIDL